MCDNIRKVQSSGEELYKTLANNLQIGVYIIQKKRLQFVNLHMQEYTGYTETEIREMDPLSAVYPADRVDGGQECYQYAQGDAGIALRISAGDEAGADQVDYGDGDANRF